MYSIVESARRLAPSTLLFVFDVLRSTSGYTKFDEFSVILHDDMMVDDNDSYLDMVHTYDLPSRLHQFCDDMRQIA